MEYSNQKLVKGVNRGDVAAFEELFRQYYIYLCLVAEHIVRNHSDAEEIVSDVFVKLWNIRDTINITTSIKWYLVKAVRNTSLNYLEKNKSTNKLTISLSSSDYQILSWDSDYPLGQLFQEEILNILDNGINELPEACKVIFKLSRNDDMNYIQIAGKLGISVNTVKTQMKIALARLRVKLKEFLIILLVFMLF